MKKDIDPYLMDTTKKFRFLWLIAKKTQMNKAACGTTYQQKKYVNFNKVLIQFVNNH